VEHTITEEITGIDIVQSTMNLAAGMSLEELGLTQEEIPDPMGYAMQCRVTTENPAQVGTSIRYKPVQLFGFL
jgi:pyruvate carboxylase